MLKGFLLGVVTGGVAVWIWKDDIEAFLDARSRAARSRAADGVHAVGETAGGSSTARRRRSGAPRRCSTTARSTSPGTCGRSRTRFAPDRVPLFGRRGLRVPTALGTFRMGRGT